MLQQGRHAKAVHLAIERLLSSADLQPPTLPPAAVLIVRRLVDPQPGRLAPGLRAVRVHAAWERAARQQLAELQRRAARPAFGPVPAGVDAVLFADESELLACLARDVSRGLAGQRWWWRTLLRSTWGGSASAVNGEYGDVLVQQLMRQAHVVPAVLARLYGWGEAVATLRILAPAQARAVLQAMLLARGLPGLPGDRPATPRPQLPPWRTAGGIAAARPASLGRERDALLGLALDLVARPQLVASMTYQRRFHAWWHALDLQDVPQPVKVPAGVTTDTPALTSSPKPVRAPSDTSATTSDLTSLLQPARHTDDAGQGSPDWPRHQRPAGAHDATGDAPDLVGIPPPVRTFDTAVDPTDLTTLPKPATSSDHATAETSELLGIPRPVRSPEDSASEAPELIGFPLPVMSSASFTPLLADGVPTQLGGVLYLINLMVALDLPACFEAGWRLASGVGPWGLLHALGQELLPGDAAAPDDPLWLVLAHLDGRAPGQGPGVRLPRSRPRRWPPFELPPAWLTGLPDAGTQPAATSRGRFQQQTTGLRSRYPPLLARWLALALPFIGLRLRLALDLSDEVGLAEGLLWLPGQLYVTATHVDLAVSLEHISLPVRLAGLDRNPGWLPDFARVVTFHFS